MTSGNKENNNYPSGSKNAANLYQPKFCNTANKASSNTTNQTKMQQSLSALGAFATLSPRHYH